MAELVTDAIRAGRRLQVASRFARSAPEPDPVGAALRRLRWVLDVDREAGWVKVHSGATLGHLAETLSAHGLALCDLPADRSLTLAEVLAMGPPGTGIETGSLASQIESLNLVDGTGRLHTLSCESDESWFLAAQVGLGAIGVVSDLTIRCRPDYNLRAQLEVCRTDSILDRLDELRRESDHLELTWLPGLDRCLVLRAVRTDEEPTRQGRAALSRRLRRSAPELRGAAWIGVMAGAELAHSYGWVDRAHRVLLGEFAAAFDAPRYALPAQTAGQVWHTLRSWLGEHCGAAGRPIRFRFGAADQAYLSPAFGRATLWIELPGLLLDSGNASTGGAASELDTLLAALGGRPQWGTRPQSGKRDTPPAGELASRYPRWAEWCEARQQLDPHGVFEPVVPI